MSARKRKLSGFTLVEILIVVVILGILAAIVIPQFTSASETAKASSLVTQLQSIRSQLELYQIQHNGDYPTAAQMAQFLNLTIATDVLGAAGIDYGPYLMKAPANPFTAGVLGIEVAAGSGALGVATAAVGWVYNDVNGEVQGSMEVTKAIDSGLLDPGQTGADSGDIQTY